MKTVLNVVTKLDKNDKAPKKTVLTMDYEGCAVNDLIGPAEDSLVISLQGRWRRAKSVPSTLVVNVKQLIETLKSRAGGPETVESLTAKAATMSPAEIAALVEMLKGKQQATGTGSKK